MKRHLVYPIHFDTRAYSLDPVQPGWDEKLHEEQRQRVVDAIAAKFGTVDLETKVGNFRDLRELPFSIVSYHNHLFQEAREAFVVGSYYSAATAACALGERILNHLVLDLRSEFTGTPAYKKVHSKNSFDNWSVAIEVLSAWRVLRNETPILFERLGRIRNRLIHFSPDLYGNERAIALEALTILSSAVNLQFGFFSAERWWAIKGTKGAQFIATDAERDPFIRKFYLPRSPVVGPHYAIDIRPEGYAFFDRSEYPSGEISDENFAELYNARTLDDVVPAVPSGDVEFIGVINRSGSFLPARRMDDGGWILDESPKY